MKYLLFLGLSLCLICVFTYKYGKMNKVKYVSNPNLESVKQDFKGNAMIDNIYSNYTVKAKAPLWDVIKWKLSINPQKKEKEKDTFCLKTEKDLSFLNNKRDVMVWLGHSFFYIRLNGIIYVTDPIISNLPTSKRKIESPYTVEELGKIDYVLISHNHYDHFDTPTLQKLAKHNPKMEFFCPLGISDLLNSINLNSMKRQEAGWYQTYKTKSNTVTLVPAKHWSRRGLFDFNKSLWGGFVISSDSLKIYFAGDTAEELKFFSDINEIYNGFDFCLLPIGAYKPQFLMKEEHLNPKEALRLFQKVNGKYFIPMHYGTYDLSDEPLGEPIKLLCSEAEKLNLSEKIRPLIVGKPFYLSRKKNI